MRKRGCWGPQAQYINKAEEHRNQAKTCSSQKFKGERRSQKRGSARIRKGRQQWDTSEGLQKAR